MVILDERTIGIWYMVLPGGKSDWMGSLRQETPDTIKLQYRFRYYKDNDPWSDNDKKNWYEGTSKVGLAVALDAMRDVVMEFEEMTGGRCEELLMAGGGIEKFMEDFQSRGWAHFKMVN